ncbi:hypothetical protein M422DRAFT_776733 [Sphaerobolus stellatus SS14]|nr:hypothetical protein M422DRAFT_776733 [Sphaerobolus stellatus SS14]
MLAGKPNPSSFPFTSISFTARSPMDPSSETACTIDGQELADALQYSSTSGIPRLLEWLTNLQTTFHGRQKGEGWRISAFHSLVNDGDSVLIESPVYAGVLPISQSLHCDLVEIETDAEGIKADSVRNVLKNWPKDKPKPRVLYTVPYGCNPTGMTATTERLRVSFLFPFILSAGIRIGYEGFKKLIEKISALYVAKRDAFEMAMKKHLTGLAEWVVPEAGMFFWFKLLIPSSEGAPEGDSEELIRTRALENGVLALPGAIFLPNNRKSAYVPASFSILEEKDVDEALRRLAEVVKQAQSA